MMFQKRKPDKLTVLSILSVAVLALLVIPIIIASFYTHPVSDDYAFTIGVHHAIESGGNIFDVLNAACKEVVKIYHDWQGTYAAVFLFALQPGVFSQDLYFLTSVMMVLSLTVSTFFLSNTIISAWLKCDKRYAVILAALMLSFGIQFIPDICQGFFWYNGSSYYTLFYSFSLIYFGLLIRLLLTEKKSNAIVITVFLVLLSIMIGGGNYATAMGSSIISVLICIWCFISRNSRKYLALFITLILLLAYAVSIIAPGNAVRAAVHHSLNPLTAIYKSFYYAFGFIGKWTGLTELAFFIAVSPIVFTAAKKSDLQFKHPAISLVLLLCVFSAQFTPSVYAMGSPGPGRLLNIYYYSYYWMILFAMFLVFGYINQRYSLPSENRMSHRVKKYITIAVSCLCVFQIICGCLAYDVRNMTSVKAAYTVVSGQAAKYDIAFDDIIQDLETPCEICYIHDITEKPEIYPSLGLSNEKGEDDRNEELAEYYHHDKVVLIEEDPS